jgi:hypothetical protein
MIPSGRRSGCSPIGGLVSQATLPRGRSPKWAWIGLSSSLASCSRARFLSCCLRFRSYGEKVPPQFDPIRLASDGSISARRNTRSVPSASPDGAMSTSARTSPSSVCGGSDCSERIVGYSSIATIGLRPPPDDVGRQKGCKVRIARNPNATTMKSGVLSRTE